MCVDPVTHLVLPAYLDMQHKLAVLNQKFDRNMLNLNTVADEVLKFRKWIYRYAVSTTAADDEPSEVLKLANQFLNNKLPEDMFQPKHAMCCLALKMKLN